MNTPGPSTSLILLIVLGLFGIFDSGIGSVSIAAETSGGHIDEAAVEPPEEPPPPEDRRLFSGLQGATPEERARLTAERKRLSEAASAFGTDPTAIIGYYQLTYGHSQFTLGQRLDTATAVIRLPVTPNFGVQATVPYVWADQQRQGFPTNGLSDTVVRVGGRVYASEYVAVFLGTDVLFPTASPDRLGTGKYTLGPGGVLAAPLARVRSMFYLLVQDYSSVGGDPSRTDLHFLQVQGTINTIWSDHWWTSVQGTWNNDWNTHRPTASNVVGQIGYRFDNHWNVFAGPGVGITGDNTPLGLDWTVQAGIRWVFRTPLIPERLFKGLPKEGG
ncbi:MAG TPA: hypothetical protein VEI50_11725 [Nitrospiraceae bacterium]|nr:hypothetical protein [Nitrospiraceae bacterium]